MHQKTLDTTVLYLISMAKMERLWTIKYLKVSNQMH
jgi:hypothetical protein